MSFSPCSHCALLVDDDAGVLLALKMLMKSMGWEYVGASNAKVALERLGERSYGVAIIDINMPGASGIELCRLIHLNDNKPVPVVLMLSGLVDPKVCEEARMAGATAVLSKPIGRQEMIDEFRRHGLPCCS